MGRRANNMPHDSVTHVAPIGPRATLEPKLKVWIVFGDRVKFGHGRAQLLQTIDELGSLRKAAAQLGMSYRSVWGYLRALETAAGFPFLERRVGGKGRGGTTLTPEGRAFLARYLAFRHQVDALAEQQFVRSFLSPE
jgi:molybdate transport repressor ModE-like protein